jgi:hypothetical protein
MRRAFRDQCSPSSFEWPELLIQLAPKLLVGDQQARLRLSEALLDCSDDMNLLGRGVDLLGERRTA